MNVDYMWFQKEGTTYLTAWEIIQLLIESFPGHVISCCGDHN